MSITLSMYCAHNASISIIAAHRYYVGVGVGVTDIHIAYKVSISSRWGFAWGRVIGQHIAIRISSVLPVHWLSPFQESPPSQRIHIRAMDVCVRVAFCIHIANGKSSKRQQITKNNVIFNVFLID